MRATPWWGWALLPLVLAVAVWMVWQGQLWGRADLRSARARKAAVDWASGARKPPDEAEWARALQAMRAARELQPRHPGLAEQTGDLYMVAARRDWDDAVQREAALQQAVQHYRQALEMRPADPQTWAGLATAYQGLQQRPEMQQAWLKALDLGANEGHVRPMLLELVLASWADATPQMQQWAIALFDAGNAQQQNAINRLAAQFGLTFAKQETSPP